MNRNGEVAVLKGARLANTTVPGVAAINARGEVALFVNPCDAMPDAWSLHGDEMSVFSNGRPLLSRALGPAVLAAVRSKVNPVIFVVEVGDNGDVIRHTVVGNRRHD